MLRRAGLILLAGWLCACQDYVFELRPPRRVQAKMINELVATVVPADILLVVDNSGTMAEEIAELRANVGLFVDELAKGDNDFQLGLITTDVECNIPTKDCVSPAAFTSHSCCNLNPTVCQDLDTNGDTVIDSSNCDGGRLRQAPSGRRIFRRPAPEERDAWVADFDQILAGLGTAGSSYESGLEAVVRALRCAKNDGCAPTDAAVAALNQGFLRDEADLVLIFVTDEDDCSISDRVAYERPPNDADPLDQAAHLCWPNECYAYYWTDPLAGGHFNCGPSANLPRTAVPPPLTPVSSYLTALAALKGGDVSRIRAAGILGGVADGAQPLGFGAYACVDTVLGPSNDCGCLSTSVGVPLWCELTGLLGQRNTPWPLGGGCTGMPGGRYVTFLEELATARVAALARPDTLVDSICRSEYDETLYTIVNSIILTNCFALGESPGNSEADAAKINVELNGEPLAQVPVGGDQMGWSWIPGATEICLEGGMKKAIGDRFEIFLLQQSTSP